MLFKIVQSGLMLSTLLLIPGLKDAIGPPVWVKAIVVFVGFGGLLMAFVGALVLIWV